MQSKVKNSVIPNNAPLNEVEHNENGLSLQIQMEQINENSQAILKRLLDIENGVDRVLFTTEHVFEEMERKSKDYYSIQGWFLLVGFGDLDRETLKKVEKRLEANSLNDVAPKTENDPKFGLQTMYHVSIFENVFAKELIDLREPVCTQDEFWLLRDFCKEDPTFSERGGTPFHLEIEVLTLINKKIAEIPPYIKHLKKLKHLILANNEIEQIPNYLTSLPSLEHLDLSCNYISVLPSHLDNLQKENFEVNLSENPIKYIPKNLFSFFEGRLLESENVLQYIKNNKNKK